MYDHNRQVAGVEVDLIFKRDHWLMVEVKTLKNMENLHYRLSEKQKQRLLRARQVWQSRTDSPVQLVLALVHAGEVIEVPIEDF